MGLLTSGGKPLLFGAKVLLVALGAGSATPSTPATPSGDFGLGLIGQSNMYNRQTSSTGTVYPLGHPDVTEYAGTTATGTQRRIGNVGTGAFAGSDKWGAPFATYGSNYTAGTNQGDGLIMLSGLIASGLNTRVRVVNRAKVGVSIDTWISVANGGPNDSTNNWEIFKAAVTNQASLLGITPAQLLRMVVMQIGETDSHVYSAAQWTPKVAMVHQQCKELAGNRADFLFGIYALGPGSFNGSTEGEFGKMRVAIQDYATNTPGAFFAGSTYDTATTDAVHTDSAGFHKADRRGAKAALYALGATSAATGRGGSGVGPKIDKSNTARVGSVITVNFLHAGGNALLDGLGGAGGSVTTFEVKDAGGVVIPYTCAVSSAAQAKLTLNASFTAPLTLSNAMMNVPCGSGTNPISFNPAGCLYDNDGYWQYGTTTSTTLGSPVQACAAFNIG